MCDIGLLSTNHRVSCVVCCLHNDEDIFYHVTCVAYIVCIIIVLSLLHVFVYFRYVEFHFQSLVLGAQDKRKKCRYVLTVVVYLLSW